jgi:hypothetical protein
MLTKIKCPLCHEKFELNEALDSDLREQILGLVKEEHQKHLEDTRKKAIEETKQQIDEEHKKKLEEVRKQAFDDAVKSVDNKYSTDMSFMKKQLEEKDEKVKEFREQELELRRQKAKIEEDKTEIELTVQRRLDQEREKAEQAAADRVEKEYKLKLSEKDQHIESMRKKVEELQRKQM